MFKVLCFISLLISIIHSTEECFAFRSLENGADNLKCSIRYVEDYENPRDPSNESCDPCDNTIKLKDFLEDNDNSNWKCCSCFEEFESKTGDENTITNIRDIINKNVSTEYYDKDPGLKGDIIYTFQYFCKTKSKRLLTKINNPEPNLEKNETQDTLAFEKESKEVSPQALESETETKENNPDSKIGSLIV